MRWRGRTVFILASGPSLTRADVDATLTRVQHRHIAVNDSWRMCPGADVLYAADAAWWQHRAPPTKAFTGERWTQDHGWGNDDPHKRGLSVVKSRGGAGIEPPGGSVVYTGGNSGFQALGLAVLWGARRVVFLGLDLRVMPDGEPNHWHNDYPEPLRNVRTAYPGFVRSFENAAPILTGLGVEVINATPQSALTCFPRMTIQEALK